MDFSKTLFHCYSLGYIMKNPRGKSIKMKYDEAKEKWVAKDAEYKALTNKETKTAAKLLDACAELQKKCADLKPRINEVNLSSVCKKHLINVYIELKYGRREEIKSKYLEKGLLVEEDALTLYSLYTNEYHEKNKERKENGWLTGEMDTSFADWAIDMKANWSIWQHHRVKIDQMSDIYEWQGRGYMWLFGKEKFRLVYCLLNTPNHLIEAEETKLLYEMFGNKTNYDYADESKKEVYKEACAEIRKNLTYDDIPIEEKIATFEILRNEDIEESIKTRITECRQFLQDLEDGKISHVTIEDEYEAAS